MRWIPLRQDVRGIVVAHDFRGLHAWRDGCDPRKIYEEKHHHYGDLVWMFFSVGDTERFSEVWVRHSSFLPAIVVILQRFL